MPESKDLREIINTMKAGIRANDEGFKELARKVNQLSLTIANGFDTNKKSSQPSDPAFYHDEEIPVVIDWETPEIKGIAQFYRLKDTGTAIVINIDPYYSSRVEELLDSGFVKGLVLSSVDPR